MPIEASVTQPSDLVATYPEAGDAKSFGDDHLRNIKVALRYLISVLRSTGTLGFATGAGGTVTQAGSITTGVTINTNCGQIVTVSPALADDAWTGFTVTNSAVAATDTVVLSWATTFNTDAAILVAHGVAAGSFRIRIKNETGSSMVGAHTINFAIIKGVTS